MTGGVSSVPPEARAYQGQRAGVVSRFVAAALDLVVVIGLLFGIYFAWAAARFLLDPRGFSFPTVSIVANTTAYIIVTTCYLTAAWSMTGRSYGKQVMGLRVVDVRGARLRPLMAFVRAVFCVVFPLGLFWVAFSARNRSLHDIVLRTSVIHDWTARPVYRRAG